jgi:plasmid stabilization system protein ParE
MSYCTTYSDDAKKDIKEIITYKAQFYAGTARAEKESAEHVRGSQDVL